MTRRSSPYEKLVQSLASKHKPFVNLLIHRNSQAIKHLPDKESLIELVWKRCAILLLLTIRYPNIRSIISSTRVSRQNAKWTTFLGKLSMSNPNDQSTLHTLLFQTLVLELISKEKDYRPFWTPAYSVLSEKLLLPIEIDSADSALTSSSSSFTNRVVQSPSLTIRETRVPSRSCPKTCFQLFTSTVVDKWAKPSGTKALKIKLSPTHEQRKLIDEWINTSNYVYNKTVEAINNGAPINFQTLRDMVVTRNTKKTNPEYQQLCEEIAKIRHARCQAVSGGTEHSQLGRLIEEKKTELRERAKSMPSTCNSHVQDWESRTPRFFRLGYRKHLNRAKSVLIPKNFVNAKDGYLRIAPQFFKEQCVFKLGKKTLKRHKQLTVNHDSRIMKKKSEYWIVIPVGVSTEPFKVPVNYCGIDPGSRTFMTAFGNTGCREYIHNKELIDRLNKKLALLKSYRTRLRRQHQRNRYRKRALNKLEQRKSNIIDECHWRTILDVLKCNDMIFYGDIKSHDIVKKSSNASLNRSINDLKLYQFKERLMYKASVANKKVVLVNEAYTTQTCSSCGYMYKPRCSEVYSCSNCSRRMGRDINASKNILMKGIITYL